MVAFVWARLDEDERELVKDPPHGLGYANLAARMRREVAAMRDILTAYVKIEADGHRDNGWIALRFAVETLAAIWSDHPDYRAERKP